MAKNKKEYKVKIEGETWKDATDKALKEASDKVKIDGFRKGKAPKNMVIKAYGQGNIWLDAANKCIEKAYEQAIKENEDLVIVAPPSVNISSVTDDFVEFTFNFVLKPEVKLGKYKGLKAKKESVKVTDEEVEQNLNHMREHYAEMVTKDGEIKDGDTAIIDFEGFKDGVAFEGGKGENYSLTIGSNTFIPGFEEQLIGMKKGDEKEIEVTFPSDYHVDDLKNAKATFKIKVHEVKETKLPELNEEFYEDLGMEGITDEASLKKELKENIKAKKEYEAENKYVDELLKEATDNMEVEIPHEMIHEEIDMMLHQYEENLKMQGLTLQQFYQFTNSDEESLKSQLHGDAEKRVKERLLLEEIMNVEKIEVTDKEANEHVKELAKQYNMSEQEIMQQYVNIENVKYDMKMRKALDVLKEK